MIDCRDDGAPEPVSAVIKVCALDAPYMDVVIPHMLRQAKYRFAEVLLVADPRASFTGKYARRSDGGAGAFTACLARLQASGVVDRVVMAEPTAAEVHATVGRYFAVAPAAARTEWAHDRTGAPVYSALLGLEIARHDLVLLMDADVLFHSAGPSWVAAAVALLGRDSSVWFAMTHAGPPAAEMGTRPSLDAFNRPHARWDAAQGAWYFQHATSRYFLTDRRRLRGALPALAGPRGREPLEVCFSRALQEAGAFRANLALPGSWDLHVHDHDPPFPAWAGKIVALVERGIVPPQQLGDYDLRLKRTAQRILWRALIEREFPNFDPFAAVSA